MRITKEELLLLRKRFEVEAHQYSLSQQSQARYRSWARRYIRYCGHQGIPLEQLSARSFLKQYESHSTRRQGYYALKFLFVKVRGEKNFFKIEDLYEKRQYRTKQRKKWMRRWW